MKKDIRNYGKFHPRFAAGGEVEDFDPDESIVAMEPYVPKGSMRPGRVIGEGSGGGCASGSAGGGRIGFSSSGARRAAEPTGKTAPKLSEEEEAAARQRSADYQARLKERLANKPPPEPPSAPTEGGRIGFSSLGTKKDDDQ